MSKVVVTKDTVEEILADIDLHGVLALDTETEGLEPYQGHRLFSVIISTCYNDYYFNFNDKPDHLGNLAPEDTILPRRVLKRIKRIVDNPDLIIFIHSAKFDMHFLNVENVGIRFRSQIYCTQALARLVNNRLPSYSLAALGAMIGHEKDSTVEKYISKHKLYTLVDVGKQKPRKDKHYDLVPFEIMANYGCQDGRVLFELGTNIIGRLEELALEQEQLGLPDLRQVVANELALTKTLFRMEARGVKIDRAYCQEAYEYEVDQYTEAMSKFYTYTDGIEFEDSAKCFKKAFEKLGLEAGKTDKGNDSYSADNLPENELTDIILQYRRHYKRATTYFKNFLDLADKDDIIHCNFVQGGTTTGRLSCTHPNLQNVPKRGEDSAEYPVRKAFIPREGYVFVMQDADQGEYRLLLDIAGETELITKINNGLDVHTATAEQMGVERDPAKTLNFMLLYGGGAAKLALALGILLNAAKALKAKYFSALRRVQGLIEALKSTAKRRGYIVNWLGRRILNVVGQEYVIPNHYIQGGLGDIVKVGMCRAEEYVIQNRLDIYLLLNVHDEILYECPKDILAEAIEIQGILEDSYPHKSLPITWGTDYSATSWHNKHKVTECTSCEYHTEGSVCSESAMCPSYRGKL